MTRAFLVATVLVASACGRLSFDAILPSGDAGDGGTADADVFVDTCFRGVATGNESSCVIDGRGDVWCWGSNRGFNTDPSSASQDPVLQPTKVAFSRPAVQLTIGDWVTCARLDDNSLQCVGSDFRGSLGDGAVDSAPGPVAPLIGDKIVDVAAGGLTVCAVRESDRSVMCWGTNVLFEAAATGLSVDTPTLVAGTAGTKEIALAHHHGCLVDPTNTVKCWGRGGSSEIGDPAADQPSPRTLPGYAAAARLVRGGGRFSCVIEAAGNIRCNGANDMLQLGRANGFPSAEPADTIVSGAVDASLGSMTGCALLGDHRVECWGDGTDGMLGPTALKPSNTPVTVLENVNAFATGAHHVCALKGNQVLCWGLNHWNAIGRGDLSRRPLPSAVAGLPSIDTLGVGAEHVCARAGTELYCWGANYHGQLGDESRSGRPVPGLITLGTTIDGVSSGVRNTCVWGDGFARCAGRADSGQTGDTTMPTHSLAFRTVPVLAGVTFVSVGMSHACALNGGVVRCWGGNANGELGDNTLTSTATPGTTGLSGATDVSAGHFATCAIAGTTLFCWGNNTNHEVSPAANSEYTSPQTVNLGGATPAQVSVGLRHVCVVTTAGGLKCWAGNDAGEVGNNTTANQPSPVDVALPAAAAEVRAGDKFTCARLVDGRVYCWGLNQHGELGTGDYVGSATPRQVQNITDATAIDLGDGIACARRATGAVECWGSERRGGLGSGRLTLDATPTPVALSCMP